jgi:hypothetical protein
MENIAFCFSLPFSSRDTDKGEQITDRKEYGSGSHMWKLRHFDYLIMKWLWFLTKFEGPMVAL